MHVHNPDSGASAPQVEPDVSPRLSILMWVYFFACTVAVFIAMGGLTIYFRYEVERERYAKVDSIDSSERLALEKYEQLTLEGPEQIVDGKKHIPIDQAISRLIKMQAKK